jgi:dihydrofolate reductase
LESTCPIFPASIDTEVVQLNKRTFDMGKLSVFNFATLNGYYKGLRGDISWHKHGAGEEEKEFAAEGAKSESILLFGRITYEMMASFWPTPEAAKMDPVVAEGMNKSDKIVFSRALKKADWKNTRVVKNNMLEEIKKLKELPGKDMTLLGSGSILTQLAEAGLIDQYMFMIDPIALGDGTPLFKNMKGQLNLKLTKTRTFKSGVVLLVYEPL